MAIDFNNVSIDQLKKLITDDPLSLYTYLDWLIKHETFDQESIVFGTFEYHNFFQFLTKLDSTESPDLIAKTIIFFKKLDYNIDNIIKKQVIPFIIHKENYQDYVISFQRIANIDISNLSLPIKKINLSNLF